MVDIKLYIGDSTTILKQLPPDSVDCIITSPPYYKQRIYGHNKEIGREEDIDEYVGKLKEVFKNCNRILKNTGTFFLNIGDKYINKHLKMIPERIALSLINDGWILRNKVLWYKPNAMPTPVRNRLNTTYEPVFLFVKKEGLHSYYFNISSSSRNENEEHNFNFEEFLGLTVKNSITNSFNEGTISKILKGNEMFFGVVRSSNGEKLYLINNPNKQNNIEPNMLCPLCKNKLYVEKRYPTYFFCDYCKKELPYKDKFPIPKTNNIDMKNLKEICCGNKTNNPKLFNDIKNDYNGKFTTSPANRGASPGARLSLYGEKLILQRRYKVYQSLIAEYLRFWKEKRKITIKKIDDYFEYKDTASHWLRTDAGHWGKGGSIPKPDDWKKLKQLLKFNEIYDDYICDLHLVLQTVKDHPEGKNPGDMWEIKTQPLELSHFATFPEKLVEKCIELGCPPRGVVLDPFAGSGTTGKVARDMGRESILIELVDDYIDIIKERCGDIEIRRENDKS
jgi:DNA modification methylase